MSRARIIEQAEPCDIYTYGSIVNMSDLKQQLDAELSQLVREYESRGLSPDEIGDSLAWHYELAQSRTQRERVSMQSDD